MARIRLAADDIPACLGNANFLLWFWHLSNAVGGVILHVRACDADRARNILAQPDEKGDERPLPWHCAGCGEQVYGSWKTCWRCGASIDGTQDPMFLHDPAVAKTRQPPEGDETIGLVVVAVMVLAILNKNVLLAMLAWPIIIMILFMFHGFDLGDSDRPEQDDLLGVEPESVLSPAKQSMERRCRMGKAVVRRAWQSAVIAFFVFPPLALYSLYLLLRLNTRKTPIDDCDQLRRSAAWAINLLSVLLCGFVLFVLLAATGYWAASFLSNFFGPFQPTPLRY